MAGYWQSSFFGRNIRPISSHLDHKSLANKGFILWFSQEIFLAGHSRVPGRRDNPILPTQVTNHSAGFGSSSLQTELQ